MQKQTYLTTNNKQEVSEEYSVIQIPRYGYKDAPDFVDKQTLFSSIKKAKCVLAAKYNSLASTQTIHKKWKHLPQIFNLNDALS